MDVRSCPVDACVEIQLESLQVRQAAVTETSVHNAVQHVAHARVTCSGERSMNADHETTRRWLPSSVGRSDCGTALSRSAVVFEA
jgi:hypothetical protein